MLQHCIVKLCLSHVPPLSAEHEHIQKVELLPFSAVSVCVIIQNLKVLGITRTVSDFDGLLLKKSENKACYC